MSCAMVYWGKHYKRFSTIFLKFGAVISLRPLHGKRVGSHIENGKRNKLELFR